MAIKCNSNAKGHEEKKYFESLVTDCMNQCSTENVTRKLLMVAEDFDRGLKRTTNLYASMQMYEDLG